MAYPSWDTFKINCAGNTRVSFECLARLLFKSQFGLGDYLPYYKNHAGNETATITIGNDIIGFQAKYFDVPLSNGAGQIIHSLEEARKNNPKQTKIIIYTNKEFGNPTKEPSLQNPSQQIKNSAQQKIEDKAKSLNLQIEWMFGDNILDAVAQNELIYNLFFNPYKDLTHFDEHIANVNILYANTIKSSIKVNGNEKIIPRDTYYNQLEEKVALRHNCLISGEAGSGKSAIAKLFFEKHKGINPFLYINAGYFDTNDINSIFHLEYSYTFGDFREYYKEQKYKYVIIDSVEKILAFKDHRTFNLFINSLSEDGWIFLFTMRNGNNNTKDFQDLLVNELSLECDVVNIPLLTDDELNSFLRQNYISKPYKTHFVDALHNLFFLARYTEIPNSYSSTLEQFRQSIWDRKIRGKYHETPTMQDRREQCLLTIVRVQVEEGNYTVPKEKVDIEAANELINDEILSSNGYFGYYVTHDLYVDMANVAQVDIAWNRYQDEVKGFIEHLGTSQFYLNAFITWTSEKEDYSILEEFANKLSYPELNNKWKEAILIAILKSDTFLPVFYKEYESIISANGYLLFGQILNTLQVDCQQIEGYIKYKGEDYPIMRPIGKCWDSTVNYLCDNFGAIREKNGHSAMGVLRTYSSLRTADKEIKHKAGLVMLQPHNVVAKSRIDKSQKNDRICFQNDKTASKDVFLYCDVLIPELQKIFVDAVENKWTDDHDPYYELTYYFVMANATSFNLYSIYNYLPKEVLDLYKLYWTHQKLERHRDLYSSRNGFHVAEESWGLSKEMSLRNAYFPPSALQTGIEALLTIHLKETLDFLIRFIDERTKFYVSNNMLKDSIVAFEYKSLEGQPKLVQGSISTWCLYRGTSGLVTPYLLQSIHMALERHLLERAKDKASRAEVKACLDEILQSTSSLSLIAIVVSLCEAYPDYFLDEVFVVIGNLQFLKLDKMRLTREINADTSSFMYYREPQMLEERRASSKLTHRKIDLESVLFNMQVLYENSKEEKLLKKTYDIVDNLKHQWEEEPENEKWLSQYTISRIDVRSMEKEDVKVNGKQGRIYKPHMTKEQEIDSERNLTNSQKLLRGANVRAWIDFRYKGDFDKAKGYIYDKEPAKAIEIAKEVLKELNENPNDFYLLPGDEFIPPLVGATLIRDYSDELSDSDFDFCANSLLDALEDVNYIFSSSMSELLIQLSAFSKLATKRTDLTERCAKVLTTYASIQKMLSGSRCCDTVAVMIFTRNLWNEIPKVLKLSVDMFLEAKSQNMNAETLSIADAESLLCLIPIGNVKGKILQTALICLEKVSHYWEPQEKGHDMLRANRSMASYNVARFILSSDSDNVEKEISWFERFMPNCEYADLIKAILFYTINFNYYDNFWKIWNLLYDAVINRQKHYYDDEELNTFLLNPITDQQLGDDWFDLKNKNLPFYYRIAQDIGDNPTALKAISNVAGTIGKGFYLDFVNIIYYIVSKYPDMDLGKIGPLVLLYMEKLVRRINREEPDQVKRNPNFKKKYITILGFMVNHGSSFAGTLINSIV